jgi:hypothetical protein
VFSGYSFNQPIDSIGVVSGGFGNVGLKGPIDLNQMKPNTCFFFFFVEKMHYITYYIESDKAGISAFNISQIQSGGLYNHTMLI